MYETGDYIVCQDGGVWLIFRMDGNTCTLVEHESGRLKTVPIGSEAIVRKIASREAILEAIERVGYIRTIQAPNDKTRKELFGQAMAKYDEIEWIKVIKTLYLRQQEKRLTPDEIACMERAQGYLHGEISVLLDIPLQEVEGYIAAAVASDSW